MTPGLVRARSASGVASPTTVQPAVTMPDDRPTAMSAPPVAPMASVPPIVSAQPDAPAAGPPILALLDFETSTLPHGEVQALSEALWAQLNLSGRARLLPREGTRRWLIANDLFPFLPYGPNVPMTRVIRQLHADFLVTGRIDRVQGAYCLELAIHGGGDEAPIFQDVGARVANLGEMTVSMNTLAGEALDAIESHAGQSWTTQGRPGDRGRMSVRSEERSSTPPSVDKPPLKTSRPNKTRVGSADEEPLAARPRRIGEASVATRNASDEPSNRTKAKAKAKTKAKSKAPAAAIARPAQTDALPAIGPESQPARPSEPTNGPVSGPAGAAPSASADMSPSAPASGAPETPAKGQAPTGAKGQASTDAKGQASTDAAQRADRLYKEALALGLKNPGRQEKLEEAVKLAPGDSARAQQLARDYFQLARYGDCVRACDAALAASPKNSQLLVIKGSAQFSMSQWDAAAKTCRASVAADPGNDFARYNLALALGMMGSGEAGAAWKDFMDHAAANADAQIQGLLPDARQRLAELEKQASKKPASKTAKGH
jgi:tetratricopeptide (TPR) repeat protein